MCGGARFVYTIHMSSTTANRDFEVSEIRRRDVAGMLSIMVMAFVVLSFALILLPNSSLLPATEFLLLSTLFYYSTGTGHAREAIGTMEGSYIKVS